MKSKKTFKEIVKNLAIGIWEVLLMLKKILFRLLGYCANIVLTLLLVLGVTGVIVGCAFAIYLGNYVDASVEEFNLMSTDQDRTTVIYYYDEYGNPVELNGGKLYSSENRVWVSYENIPENLINAFIAIEDKRFYDHDGVDWKRTIRATMYFALGQADSGGSTLTQQLIKNVTKNDDNTIQRKVEEIFSALNLEKVKSKEEILELYMNTVYFSQGSYGVQAAAYSYFNKDVSELTLIECAALASIVKNPYHLDPRLKPENNAERRNYILYEMLDQGKITQLEYDEAANKELKLYNKDEDELESDTDVPATDNPFEDDEVISTANSWYMDAVIEEGIDRLSEMYGVSSVAAEQMLYSGGFKIYIAMDPKVQGIMEEVYEDVELIDSIVQAQPGITQPQSAMVVVHPQTGNILGLVGGRGLKTDSRIFNYATMAKRQPGSSFKPIAVYSLALEKGIINYSTCIDDTPFTFEQYISSNGKIKYTAWPVNSTKTYKGLTVLNDAVARSVNTIAVKVMDKIGLEEAYEHLTQNLRFSTLIKDKKVNGKILSDVNLSSLALGGMTYGVTVKELTGAYTMFTNEGTYVEPRTIIEIKDQNDKVVMADDPYTYNVLTVENAALMTRILENVTQRSGSTAYGTNLSKLVDTAGKTGTTSKNNDKWFMGFTPYYIGGVWFGYEMPQTLSNFPGNPATKIWDEVMTRLHSDIVAESKKTGEPLKKFELPSTIVSFKYCKDSGLAATPACELDPRGNRTQTGYYSPDNMPEGACNKHVLVKYCNVGQGVASEYCPEADCTEVALIHVERDFPTQITITDAQYVYRPLTVGKVVYSKPNGAFFWNELEEGHYSGRTSSSKSPYNRYCAEHYNGEPYGSASIPDTSVPEVVLAIPPKVYDFSQTDSYSKDPN